MNSGCRRQMNVTVCVLSLAWLTTRRPMCGESTRATCSDTGRVLIVTSVWSCRSWSVYSMKSSVRASTNRVSAQTGHKIPGVSPVLPACPKFLRKSGIFQRLSRTFLVSDNVKIILIVDIFWHLFSDKNQAWVILEWLWNTIIFSVSTG